MKINLTLEKVIHISSLLNKVESLYYFNYRDSKFRLITIRLYVALETILHQRNEKAMLHFYLLQSSFEHSLETYDGTAIRARLDTAAYIASRGVYDTFFLACINNYISDMMNIDDYYHGLGVAHVKVAILMLHEDGFFKQKD